MNVSTRLARVLHRLRFNLWLLGANDFEGFKRRGRILGRVQRKLLHGRRSGIIVIACLLAAGCHGIQPNPTSPSAVVTSPVTPTAIQIVVTPGELPIGGGTATLVISTVASSGTVVAPGVTVSLRVDGGELSTSNVTTDETGHARLTWTGTKKATVTAESGSLTNTATIGVNEPVVFPPDTPPAPRPTPPPLPPQPPQPPQPDPLTLSVTPVPQQVVVNTPVTLTATVGKLQPGEVVLAYNWDWNGDEVIEETSAGPSRGHIYSTDGIKGPKVQALTNQGRSAIASTRVYVVTP